MKKRSRLGRGLGILLALSCCVSLAADLTIEEGVVVKFGNNAGLVVRDKLVSKDGVVFTSLKEGSVTTPPAAGDWQGISVQRSSSALGGASFGATMVRYAGAQGGAGLSMGGYAPNLRYFQVTDSTIGLQVSGAVAPKWENIGLTRNAIGIDVDGGAIPLVLGSFFEANTAYAIANHTPATIVQATGSWWGAASGPRDSLGNPLGTGDPVSAGVNYGSWSTLLPLLNPSLRLVGVSGTYIETGAATVALNCINATEYRLAENEAFSGIDYKPMADQVQYVFSSGDGKKSLFAQFRNKSGNVVTASLAGGVVVDTAAPILALVNPAAGSMVTGQIIVEATASDGSGIQKIDFLIDDKLQATRTSLPYTFSWNTDTWSEGVHEIKVLAYDIAGRLTMQSEVVAVTRTPPPPDTEGPQLSNLRLGGNVLVDGTAISAAGNLSLDVTDRSGISRIEFSIDGKNFASVTNASSGSSYQARLDIDGLANGSHALKIQAFDSLNNSTVLGVSLQVAHVAPPAPSIAQPVSGLVSRSDSLIITGTAQANAQVQVFVNDQPMGSPIATASNGGFSMPVTLNSGLNRINATASDQYGTSALSTTVQVTLDTNIPPPAANLVAAAQAAGKIHLTWNRSSDPSVVRYEVYRATGAFSSVGEALKIASPSASIALLDDMPPVDGPYYYRVVAVNSAGTPSSPSNLAQAVADNAMPKALSVAYSPTGKVDVQTGRIGQGRVDLVVTTSEALSAVPYFSIVPNGSVPITVDLVKQDDTHYSGSFLIDQNTGTGMANALFSARDLVGNRGTEIGSGATLNIDTTGPIVTGIALMPAAPIKADGNRTVAVVFTLSKAAKTTPVFKFQLSGALRTETSLTGVSQLSPTSWQGTALLPSDAGLGQPENLSFTFSASDDLDNVSTRVTALNRFQVYQGDLPPLGVPLNFKAEAKSGGKVRLTWGAVDEALAYQLYRQAPGESSLTSYQRVTGIEYLDSTTQDGKYTYAIASVRQSNGQESVSSQSSPVQVTASGTAPGAPQNLTLELISQGIKAVWQAPVSGAAPATYNLYRSSAATISTVEGLTPTKTGIKQSWIVDPTPSSSDHAYVVTALDAAGNESAISNSAYLNFSLLPVKVLQAVQSGDGQPAVSWVPNGNGSAGFDVFVGPDNAKVKLNASLLTATSLTDSGYSGGERRYTVDAVDANGTRMSRSLTLPNIVAQTVSGLPLRRGIMNKVQVQVTNLSSGAVEGASVLLKIGAYESRSATFSLNGQETRMIPVIFGGYHDLPNPATLVTTLELMPNEGELVRISRSASVDVTDGALVVGIAPEGFVRGATGKVSISIENPTEVDMEILTARNNGADASDELRFKLLDKDGNVLASQPYKQVLGASVITLVSGQTVARIPAGTTYTSDAFLVTVPVSAPDLVTVRLEMDKLRYHTGQPDAVAIRGRNSEKQASLTETAYVGEISTIDPASSFGDKSILITGRAVDRLKGVALANMPLKLILNQEGFERKYDLLTDAVGGFTYTFQPTVTDAGLFRIAALHPDMTDRPVQGQFVINRVTVSPASFKLSIPRNYPYTIDFRAVSAAGTSASNLRLSYETQYQPTGSLPQGISVQLPAPISIAAKQNLSLPVIVSSDNTAQPTGTFVLKVWSDESGAQPLGTLTVSYVLSEAKPILTVTPNFVESGLAQGDTALESVTLENKGFASMNDVSVSLADSSGGSAPAWIGLATNAALGTLQVGDKRSVDINVAPTAGVSEGVYQFKLNVAASNMPTAPINVFVSVTQSGIGNVLFKASDIYTATRDRNGNLIPGLAGAHITLQNEAVASQIYDLTTDSLGESLFQNIPAGRYKFKATATNHQEVAGRLQIKPGLTLNQPVFLDYNLITVEWNVREVTIQDRYEITLQATYETDVPAPVVVLEPSSINLPKMNAGDVYYGELVLTNYGLVRADNVQQQLPGSDAFFRYEFLVQVPDKLEAKQRLTIPYRLVALQSLDQPAGTASGAGCYNYSAATRVTCSYVCANGIKSESCGSSTYWYANSSSTCSGGGSSSGSSGGSGGIGAGGWGGSGGPSYVEMPGIPSCVKCPTCNKSGGGLGQ